MNYDRRDLIEFISESNRIEGLTYGALQVEIDAHETLLALDNMGAEALQEFVHVVAGARLRDRPGLDVRVGDHVPPRGGAAVVAELAGVLYRVRNQLDSPRAAHVAYENLHPFTDGNGRSGRALWAWQMLHEERWPGIRLGFLHCYYYQTLAESR